MLFAENIFELKSPTHFTNNVAKLLVRILSADDNADGVKPVGGIRTVSTNSLPTRAD